MAKAKAPSASGLVRFAISSGVIPTDAQVSRTGDATWRSGPFDLVTRLERQADGLASWHTWVGDSKFGPAMIKYGRMAVRIESATGDTAAWPAQDTPDAEFQDYLRRGMGTSFHFVTDRNDLALILASESDIRRGDLTTWLPRPSYPARLVQALILAEDLGSDALVQTIRERLHSGPIVLADGTSLEVTNTAQRWAREYGKALGIGVIV